jgi:hypothetical protein
LTLMIVETPNQEDGCMSVRAVGQTINYSAALPNIIRTLLSERPS